MDVMGRLLGNVIKRIDDKREFKYNWELKFINKIGFFCGVVGSYLRFKININI